MTGDQEGVSIIFAGQFCGFHASTAKLWIHQVEGRFWRDFKIVVITVFESHPQIPKLWLVIVYTPTNGMAPKITPLSGLESERLSHNPD